MRQELALRIEQRLNPIEEALRGELLDIFQDLQVQLFQIYRSSRTAPTQGDISGPADGGLPNLESPGETQMTAVDEALEAFRVPEFCLEGDEFSNLFWDPAVPQMQQRTLTLDSGYGSLQPAPMFVPDDGMANWERDECEGGKGKEVEWHPRL